MNNSSYILANILSLSNEQLFKCVLELTDPNAVHTTVNFIARQIVTELGLDYVHTKEIVTKHVLETAASKWADDYGYNRNNKY